MKIIKIICLGLFAISALSCSRIEIPVDKESEAAKSSTISAACRIDNTLPPLATKSLIDQVTTQSMQANFVRIDEDVLGGNDDNTKSNGLYTFTGYNGGLTPVPYQTVNWERASLLEATVISSPDNTADIHYRSISFDPIQSYKILAVADPLSEEDDTTHFYHTRMVGWYPNNCTLKRNAQGHAVYTLLDDDKFKDVIFPDIVPLGESRPRVGVLFDNLDGSKDVMMSNVREAQHWHHKDLVNPHPSDISPIDNTTNIYAAPFGHYTSGPIYSNYFTYKHYLSAIRVWAYADQSLQNLNMWGQLTNIVLQNQPNSCRIWLPEELDTEFGEVYEWGSPTNMSIITTPMFGDDSNHSDDNFTASYPITLNGAGSVNQRVYLGYALIKPDSPLSVELHTSNGVYVVDIDSKYIKPDNTEVDIFKAGFVYDVMLNLQTSGTIGVLLENESNQHYFDLSTLKEFHVGGETVLSYKYANCYIVSPNEDSYKRLDTLTNTLVPYEGFCFSAITVGNGQAGILSYGSQNMYPTNASISPSYAQLIWESSLGLISDIELMYGYVRFRLPDPDIEGNAVVGVYDNNNKLLWSWHLWITDYPQEVSFTQGSNTITFLDRNLGATTSRWTGAGDALETYGLYYQWGRKDPSMPPSTYNYSQINMTCAPYFDYSSERHTTAEIKQIPKPTLKDGVENPLYLVLPAGKTQYYEFNWVDENNNLLWGYNDGVMTKTIYDPCPFGYRVSASELNSLFSESTPTYTTYGQIHRIGSTDFYFPYAGYKGVDVGLNSIVGEWKYVGRKGDYQSAVYSEDTDDKYLHRSRAYLSYAETWSETGAGNYSSRITQDYTNRRTAASVRCVKNLDYGIITSNMSLSSNILSSNNVITINTTAQSTESRIVRAKLERKYILAATLEERVDVLFDNVSVGATTWSQTTSYTIPDAATLATTTGVFSFVFTVTNDLGLVSSSTKTASKLDYVVDFDTNVQWITVDSPLVGVEEPLIGQPVKLTVNIDADQNVTGVTINGETANTIGSINTGSVFNATYQATTTFSTPENHNVNVVITFAGGATVTVSRNVPVWGITLGTKLSSASFSTSTYYVIENNLYQNTTYNNKYLCVNSEGTTITIDADYDYYSLFRFGGTTSPCTILSTSSGKYFNRNGSTLQLSPASSTWTFRYSTTYNNAFDIRGSNSTYLRQTNETTIALGNNTQNRYWYIYPISFKDPDTY